MVILAKTSNKLIRIRGSRIDYFAHAHPYPIDSSDVMRFKFIALRPSAAVIDKPPCLLISIAVRVNEIPVRMRSSPPTPSHFRNGDDTVVRNSDQASCRPPRSQLPSYSGRQPFLPKRSSSRRLADDVPHGLLLLPVAEPSRTRLSVTISLIYHHSWNAPTQYTDSHFA
jgi:hypothetical protein